LISCDHLQGHWQRDWIKAPGFEDGSTCVHWLQSGALFADLRIPLKRPNAAGLSCLADFDASALLVLMKAEGFAGHITVEDGKCTWHRQINWHGVPEQSDIGLMSFDDAGCLIEDGVLAEYRELWQAMPQPILRSTKVNCGVMSGVLIENDAVFVLAIGPIPSGNTQDLTAALESGIVKVPALNQHFSSAYVLGRWDGAHGIAELSTNPFYEGHVALERVDNLIWHSVAFDGQQNAQRLVAD
jgi:hypothetical protein